MSSYRDVTYKPERPAEVNILVATSPDYMTEEINKALKDGWALLGDLKVVDSSRYLQMMVKYPRHISSSMGPM